ncbi:hypothetical protein [uncultured Microbulbifer sp.]|uniref:hypothetical protein n=1 Tax=uncultured Microbulbifer sp. TaxID=348147 RepID=UPI0026263A7E|nr:hypothetical protein [uncultured Microbulbifer sp.]
MFIEFTPTRLHPTGSGKLEAILQQYESGAPRVEGREHRALSGATETTVYRIEREYPCRTAPITLSPAGLAVWDAFAASCGAGEFFTFDPFGTEAAPDTPGTVQLKFGSFKQQRQPAWRFVFSFTIVEILA